MQANISDQYQDHPHMAEAERILRACVHCGFCTATCPTYQLLGDELDGPRGRIYLIKQVLEGNAVTAKTQSHLDRCLTCRSCETTCPSGVRYGRLVDIGREIVEQQVPRTLSDRLQRFFLRKIIPYPTRFIPLLKIGQIAKVILPATLRKKIPTIPRTTPPTGVPQTRKMLTLQGCVQSVMTPQTNEAASRVLQKFGIELLSASSAGCCGAVSHHLSATEEGLCFMRRNIDAWWPYVEQGVEAIVMTASGCGALVKEYGELLKHDPRYADKAKRISQLAKDISEILAHETIDIKQRKAFPGSVAFHSPCTLQHAQKINGRVETILSKVGISLISVADAHLCCGSAGTYSILQAQLSQQLLSNKLSALQKHQPSMIVTANIGCQMHLASQANVPVKHWIELLDEVLR